MNKDDNIRDPASTPSSDGAEETTVGNYFVSNYPPFSFWRPDRIPEVQRLLDQRPDEDTPLGVYVHVPFCRRRCDFCYFRVYTGREAKDVTRYLEAVICEMELYGQRAAIAGRRPRFVYFGGGTPSFLSAEDLRFLFDGLRRCFPWDDVEEVTFECEPGTLDTEKIQTLHELGVTRLSLGVENFDPRILELNNRAHRAKEIDVAYGAARAAGLNQINVDLIAGMVGETEDNWKDCVRKIRAMAPEAVTIYQMEIPYNTTVYERMKDGGEEVAPVADWSTKRRWVAEAFAALEEDGYRIGSAYTAVKDDSVGFLYRDNLWHGADMLGLGVASFSHLNGVHFQNDHHLDSYVATLDGGELPLHRALSLDDEERLIRELVLQLKLGEVRMSYFSTKFGVDIGDRFQATWDAAEADGLLTLGEDRVTLTRPGLLQVDGLLHGFFKDEHRGARYA